MKLPDVLEIQPLTAPIRATVSLPGSKSVTNRALLLAALAEGRSVLRRALWADDTEVMVGCLKALGFRVRVARRNESSLRDIEVTGHGGRIPTHRAELFVGNAGTAARFILAFVATGRGEFRVDGVERMRERPMGDLFAALRSLGAEIRCERKVDCLPAVILARGLRGNAVSIRADKSSQFASALLMIAPLVESETRGAAEFSLKLAGAPVSEPYLRMTEELMRRFGVPARPMKTGRGWRVRRGQRYRARNFVVPPDASAASYFEAAAALCGRSVNIRGLGRLFEDSLQGDAAFAEYLERLGCAVCERGGLQILGPIQPKRFFPKPLDMADVSDVAITLAVVAPFLARPTTIRGLAHARLQETDRVAAVANELRKLGVRVECRADGWKIFPARQFTSAEIETYNDHRIAMAFSVLGLKDVMGDGQPWIRIRNPSCVSKTFPDFYERLAELRS